MNTNIHPSHKARALTGQQYVNELLAELKALENKATAKRLAQAGLSAPELVNAYIALKSA